MSASEFPRPIDRRHLPSRELHLEANEAECAALAERFGLVAIQRLDARVVLTTDGEAIDADGTLEAEVIQSCAISGDDLPVRIREAIVLRFVPETAIPEPGEEIELEEDELDEIPFAGHVFDLGEAVAQTLSLAIDPFAVGPGAETVRTEAGLLDEGQAGPFGALAALKKN
ncbi:YceD family protein [Tsuneonella sp. HG222]